MTTMRDILLADLEALFGEYGFAEDAVFKPAVGAQSTIRVIFDAAFQEVDPKSKAPVGSVGPAAHLMASALPDDLDEEDRLVIRGATYRVSVPKPDGQGGVLCRLHKVSA